MTGVREREVTDGRRIDLRRTVVRRLAVQEARRLLTHPFVWLGVVLGAVLTAGANFFQSAAPVLHRDDAYVAMICAPLAVATLLAANLAVTRGRRHGTEELFEPTPTRASARTAAHLVSLAAPVVLAVLVGGAWLGWAATRPGGVGTPGVAQSLHGPALVFVAGAIGVAVGRWTPWRIAPVLVLPILVFPLGLSDTQGWARWMAWFRQPSGGVVPELTAWPETEHLMYLVGVGLIAATVALLRHGATGRKLAAAGVVVSLTAGGAFAQTRVPDQADVQAAFALAQDPSLLHECRTQRSVTSCVWPAYAPLVERWTPLLAGAVKPLPPQLRPDLRVEMATEPDALFDVVNSLADSTERARWIAQLHELQGAEEYAPVRAGQRDAIVTTPAWPGSMILDQTRFTWALAAATRAVGFDPGPTLRDRIVTGDDVDHWNAGAGWPGRNEGRPMPEVSDTYAVQTQCSTGGQARAVVALWLAAQTTDDTAGYAARRADPAARLADGWGPEDVVSPWVANYYGGYVTADHASRQWTVADLELAVQLLERPTHEVAAALVGDWQQWTDPATPSGELQEAFGLDAPLTAQQRLAAAGLSPNDIPEHALDPTAWGGPEMTTCP